jgi:hypothetical protein
LRDFGVRTVTKRLSDHGKSVRGKAKFASRFNTFWLSAVIAQIFIFPKIKNRAYLPPSRLDEEGRMRIVTTREAGSDGRDRVA